MTNKSNYEYLLSDLTNLKGVGAKTTNLLKKKKINNIFDLLWKLPKSYTDRSRSIKISDLKIGETQTVTIVPKKLSCPIPYSFIKIVAFEITFFVNFNRSPIKNFLY